MPSQVASNSLSRKPVRRVDDRLMFVIMAGLLFFVGATQLALSTDTVESAPAPMGARIEWRSLYFSDQSGGRVEARDAVTGEVVKEFVSGEGSFVRGVLRSLVRARSLRSLEASQAFELSLYQDGRLTLQDPQTGEMIDLVAFGPTNYQAFSQLLSAND